MQSTSEYLKVSRGVSEYLGDLDLANKLRLTRRWVWVWIIESSSVWGNVWSVVEMEYVRSLETGIFHRRGWNSGVSPHNGPEDLGAMAWYDCWLLRGLTRVNTNSTTHKEVQQDCLSNWGFSPNSGGRQPSWYRSGWIMLRIPLTLTRAVKSFVCCNQDAAGPVLLFKWGYTFLHPSREYTY